MTSPPKILLYTDAGIKDGVATWATVAILPDGSEVEASGRLRDPTICSTTAELRAIANALHKAVARGDLRRGYSVHVFTDSKAAVNRIDGTSFRRPESSMAKANLVILRLASVHGFRIKATWIPGHKPDSFSPHAPFNNRCDRLCKEARRHVALTLDRKTIARRAMLSLRIER